MPSNHSARIYLDYHASTPTDPRVIEAMAPYWTERPGNPHAIDHAHGWDASEAVERAASRVAAAINADADEIIFTSGATEANNLAILGVAARASGKRRILVSAVEHKSVLAAAHTAARRYGMDVELVAVDSEGAIRLDCLKSALADDVLLVSVMAVNNEVGTIQPLGAIARLANAAGALLHTDASQALTAGSLDVSSIGADLVSLSAHKLYGPKGIGALYIRRDVQRQVEPLVYGGGQQNGLRAGTLPVPLCVGFGEAVALVADDCAEGERGRVRALRDKLFAGLGRAAAGLRLNGPQVNSRHPGNANIMFPDMEADPLLAKLQPAIAASTGSACTSGTIEPSHVLRAIGLTETEANSSIRFSIGRFTTDNEIEQAITLISQAVLDLNKQQ